MPHHSIEHRAGSDGYNVDVCVTSTTVVSVPNEAHLPMLTTESFIRMQR